MQTSRPLAGLFLLGLLTGLVAPASPVTAQNQAPDHRSQATPPARTHYLGRRIAHTMHWKGGEWLLRETREKEENTSRVVRELRLQPGMVVCDLGCGSGYYTLTLARAVRGHNDAGDQGKVIGVEIQEEYFADLRQRIAKAELDNIELHIGTVADPKLPESSCDMIFLVDVYHEFSHPEHMLQNMRRALKPNGVLVLLEFRAEDPNVPIRPLHKMSKAQIMKELPVNGYKLVREYDGLPWQHMMFFARDDSELKAIEPNENWRAVMEAEKKKRGEAGEHHKNSEGAERSQRSGTADERR